MGRQPQRRGFGGGRILIALAIAAFSLISYFGTKEYNPVTDEVQHVDLRPEQEIALGLQAAPQMAQQHGGLHPDQEAQGVVDQICARIVSRSAAKESPYKFECHVLADEETVNAFALPGGQVFITAGLLKQLQTEGQVAGVLGHEIGHVVARHGAEHMAKARLTQGLTGAAVLATYDPENPSSRNNAAVAMLIGQMVNMRFGREDELESDRLGVRFMAESGYDPRAMVDVMRVLEEAGGGGRQPEFFSTHPNPGRRIERIQQMIAETFPQGVPGDLQS
ncbi:MAG TPA: M48 family metallopeptidase [Thermoanaerobaculia bacterium]|nr:M48 family metallopeptidase [Thermoanaerobaculia bacterium]